MLVIGDKELENGTVTPRLRKVKKQREATPVDEIVGELARAVGERHAVPFS